MTNKTFTVLPEHIKLLKAAELRWDDSEFGAPGIDSKRPYGNSSVIFDIAEILGYLDKDGEYDRDKESYMYQLHQETLTVLAITISTGTMEIGTYEATEVGCYRYEWKKV
jgi:hypothetical protein